MKPTALPCLLCLCISSAVGAACSDPEAAPSPGPTFDVVSDAPTPDLSPPPPDTAEPPAPVCGNGVIEGDEVCDDGEDNGAWNRCGVGCNGPGIRCGNGFIEPEFEVCDDGDARNGQWGRCAADCQGLAGRCGDGVVEAPWESCDDGEDNGEPGFCPVDCNPTPGCGDGERVDPEDCDDGPKNGMYGFCAADCSGPGPRCGDGFKDKPEACDDGEDNGSYNHCTTDCMAFGPRCGDGVIDAPMESCDDGDDNGLRDRCNRSCNGMTNPFIATPEELAAGLRDAYTCKDGDLLQKYMHYRLRLRGDGTARFPGFVSRGTGAGMSMPASRREPGASCQSHWSLTSCPRPDAPDAHGFYKWGDGTIWLGEYIAVLALDVALFSRLGLRTDESLEELRLALLALDRVDEKAEEFYPGVAPARDGFFVRDDIPLGFASLPEGGWRFPRDDGFAGYECVQGDLLCEPPNIEHGSFTSQDQTIGLLFGLSLVRTLVPPGTMAGNMEVHADAGEKIHRLVSALRDNGWKVKDPAGESPPDAWGGNAIGFSNAMALVANRSVGDSFGVSDYRNFASRTLGEASWTGLQAIWGQTHGYNRTMALKLAAVGGIWDARKIANRAMGDAKDHFALVHALVEGRGTAAPMSDWRIERLLRSAPCSGPCRGASCEVEAPGWLGESRTMNPEDRFGSRHFDGEFNGLDYMLIFASYFLHRDGRYAVVPAGRVPLDACRAHLGLDAIVADTGSSSLTYDPRTDCARSVDLHREFCGRPFGAWIDDAARGAVTVFTGAFRWTCTSGGTCSLSRDSRRRTDGDDLIVGTPGDDTLEGGTGNDCLVGLGGADTLEGGQGFDVLDGGNGDDSLYGEGRGLVVDGEADVLDGGAGNDLLDGGPGADELVGGDGDDTLDGGSGEDSLRGEAGSDRLDGGGGDDTLDGGPGDDWLDAGSGSDACWGGPGRDRLDGAPGDDYLHGGTGPDFIRGGDGADVLISGDENGENAGDRLCGNGGDDTIWAGWDGDACLGGGWFLGGQDAVHGCEDGSASEGECDKGPWESW